MKKVFLSFAVLIALLLFGGAYLVEGEYRYIGTWQADWVPLGSGLNAGVYDTDDIRSLGVSERSSSFVESHCQVYRIPPYWNYIEIRCAIKSESSSVSVFDLYLSTPTGSDYILGTSLIFTKGGQLHTGKSGYYYADTIEDSEYLLLGSTLTAADNHVALYRMDRHWAKKIAIVPTALDNETFLEIIGY
ncbi:MAG TPA: hypothetical protein PLX18_10995 [Anaerohalosphaeraceae bacterium]|nr:hypothetical protein [Anaerohalosphaeraceae bacterium]HQI08366.1 hypothetical protein [Anaerohalosphaeraceae bacterium]